MNEPENEPTLSPKSGIHQFRPAWRYQWTALAGVVLLLVAAGAVLLWGKVYIATRFVRLLAIVLAALGVYLLMLAFYRRYVWRYTLDDERVESQRGLIGRQVRSVRLRDLRNINVRQSLMQRLLDVGDVEFSSAAGEEVEVTFFGVPDPIGLKDYVQGRQRGGAGRGDE